MLPLLLASFLPFFQENTNEAKAEVRVASALYEKSLAMKDKEGLRKILAKDFILTTATGKIINKEGMLANLEKQDTHYDSFDSTETEIRVTGNVAVETGKVRTKGTRAGKKIDETTRFTVVWMKSLTGWIAVAEHSSSIQGN